MALKKPSPPLKTVKMWMLTAVPVLFILGGITHFVYEWSGNNVLVGIFCPVNESPWEHLKMAFWLPLLWWIVTYCLMSKKYDISPARWFTSAAIALYVAPLFIISFFYTYTGALGFESVILDILSLLFGLAVGNAEAYHYYKFGKADESRLKYSILAIAVLAAAFVIFTFYPPHIPMFLDSNTGTYGIQ